MDADEKSRSSELAEALAERDAAAREAQEAAGIEAARRERVRTLQESFESTARNDVLRRADRGRWAAAAFFREVAGRRIQALQADLRMPQTINYVQRYQAFTRMQDRKQMLARLEQTVHLASKILDAVPRLNPDEACREAARGIRLDVQVCANVPVPFAKGAKESGGVHAFPGAKAVVRSLDGVLQAAFEANAQSFSEKTPQEVSEEEFGKLCDRLWSKLDQAFVAFRDEQAVLVGGKTLSPDKLGEYDGHVTYELRYDPGVLRLLLEEVQRSLETFKQVVADNGLFAAFLDESDYGQCCGYSWGWVGEFGEEVFASYGGANPRTSSGGSIPLAFEEDEGGDSLLKAAERMKVFNAKKYFGMLDDDFSFHVKAFWYGFVKLMEFTNDLVNVELAPLRDYLFVVRETLKDQAALLGASMDDEQLDQWEESLAEAAKNF
ncbi:hypothetical protein [uncultured Adlercreutzia sp.]|uniref:hypothetical protein n=1 Tax=uncultured Adlercreutzia sp. TaxID=875803 RepID=UPI0025CE6F76|nr:hypothetical protein [uncultured Adlercreutzia sp.]MCI9261634.1 hypothetical protein [Eggerthellaceae bacterium]